MGEAADRERPPWRCTVAVQAALCLALYAAFSLGEPQLIPRGGVDALGRGARGGGVAFLSVAGGARGPIDQERLLRQVRAFRTHPPTSTPYRSGISPASQFTRAFRRLVLLSSWSVVFFIWFPLFATWHCPLPHCFVMRRIFLEALLSTSPRPHFALAIGMVVCVVAARTRVKHGLVHHGSLVIQRITLSDSVTGPRRHHTRVLIGAQQPVRYGFHSYRLNK